MGSNARSYARNGEELQHSTSCGSLLGVKIPLRDGVHLNATVYRPHDQKEPLPVLVELTPYVSAPWDNIPFYYARHGYVFALVESRGRGNSEGKFNPLFQEPQDSYDVVEWLAK